MLRLCVLPPRVQEDGWARCACAQPIRALCGEQVTASALEAFWGVATPTEPGGTGGHRPRMTPSLGPLPSLLSCCRGDWLGNSSTLASPTGLASLPNKASPVHATTLGTFTLPRRE